MSEEEKEILKQVKLSNTTNMLILEILAEWAFKNKPVTSKQGVVNEAVALLHKKEMKK